METNWANQGTVFSSHITMLFIALTVDDQNEISF